MKILFIPFLIFSAVSFSTVAQNSTGIQFDHEPFATLKQKAKDQNKLVFIDAFTTWCGPCKWMAKNIFPQTEVGNFYNANFINAKIDMEKGEGIEIAKLYKVQAYPTLLFVDGNGQMVHKALGSREKDEFIELGKIAINPEKNLNGLGLKFKSQPGNFENAYAYIKELKEVDAPEMKEAFDSYFSTQEKAIWNSQANWRMLFEFVRNPENMVFVNLKQNRADFASKFTADSVDMKLTQVFINGLRMAASREDQTSWEAYKSEIENLKLKGADEVISQTSIGLAGQDKELEFKRTADYVKNYGSKNASVLNQYAWKYYEESNNPKHLLTAESWAKTGVALEPENPMIADTYAALLFKNNKKTEARLVAEKAIALGKKTGEDMSGTEELLKKINAPAPAKKKK